MFKIHEKYEEAYKSFKTGKYSSYDLIARGSCYKFGIMPDNRVLHHVFTKSKELRGLKETNLGIRLSEAQELWSIWNNKYDVITPNLKDYLRTACKASSVTTNKNFLNEP